MAKYLAAIGRSRARLRAGERLPPDGDATVRAPVAERDCPSDTTRPLSAMPPTGQAGATRLQLQIGPCGEGTVYAASWQPTEFDGAKVR